MIVSREQVREIDISRPARALYCLRLADYMLVIVCGNFLVIFLAMPFIDPEIRQTGTLIFNLVVLVPVLCFLMYTGWRHVGVIDVGVWRAYLTAFPLLLFFSVLVAWGLSIDFTNNGGQNADQSWFLVFLMSAVAFVGFGAVLLLKKMRIATFGVPLIELLRDLNSYKVKQAVDRRKLRRVDMTRGTALGVLGGMIVLSTAIAPLLIGADVTDVLQKIGLLGYFLLIRARRYFQVSADSLLAVDKRKPMLFLRSFADDEQVKFDNSETAILDLSLETRLSNHFTNFGPFIAIGSPKEPVPQIGAARVILSESEWQPRVMSWISAATSIVMYSGKSYSVTWQLAKIVNTERVAKLILMIPEVKGWRSATRAKDIAARMDYVREAFMSTKWRGALSELQNLREVRAILFRSDGSLIVIKSRPRNRDSYHLAALIAHYILLKETKGMFIGISGIVQDRQFPVDTDIFHIGAAPDNNLIIKHDDYVSSHHASLCYKDGALSIIDQRSKNGTFVNDKRLRNTPLVLNAGDRIRLGKSTVELAWVKSEHERAFADE